MFCPRHPKVQMTESGIRYENEWGVGTVMRCPECIKAGRVKLAELLAMPLKSSNRNRKQVVLPPVRMPWY